MRTPLATMIVALMLLSPAEARQCVPDGPRVFADVPAEHPQCAEIESLYRDGLTAGCRVEESVSAPTGGEQEVEIVRYFCPGKAVTRGMAAAFSEHRDPFAQIEIDGRISINDHVANAERYAKGHYWVQFTRNITHCSIEEWSENWHGPGIDVRVSRLFPTIDTVEVETSRNGFLIDMAFNVRLHCR